MSSAGLYRRVSSNEEVGRSNEYKQSHGRLLQNNFSCFLLTSEVERLKLKDPDRDGLFYRNYCRSCVEFIKMPILAAGC